MSGQQIKDQDLLRWMNVLEDYARDWDRSFDCKPDYYTQEYWYLFIGCTLGHWRGQPLTMTSACNLMKSGSNRTRETRIKRAVDDGYLEKRKAGPDGRNAMVLPTPRLEAVIRTHLTRTFLAAREALLAPETTPG